MKNFTRVLVLALLSAPLVVSAEDTGAKAKQTDTSKTSGTGTATTGSATKTTMDAKPTKLTAEELQVMAHYHELNLMEIDINKVAAKKATSEGAKTYANMLVKDHTAADKELLALAKKTKQRIPAAKPASDVEKQEKAEDKKLVAKLKTMKGADFERQYLQFMVTGHEKEVAKIDANVARVQNGELADSLRAKKPVLQHHADQARTLQPNAGGVSSTGIGTGAGATGTATGSTTGTATTGAQARTGTGTTGTAKSGTTGTATGTAKTGTGTTGTTGTSTTGSAKTGTTGTTTGAGTSTTGAGTAKTGTTGTSTGSTNPTNTTTGTDSGTQKAPPPTHRQ